MNHDDNYCGKIYSNSEHGRNENINWTTELVRVDESEILYPNCIHFVSMGQNWDKIGTVVFWAQKGICQ